MNGEQTPVFGLVSSECLQLRYLFALLNSQLGSVADRHLPDLRGTCSGVNRHS